MHATLDAAWLVRTERRAGLSVSSPANETAPLLSMPIALVDAPCTSMLVAEISQLVLAAACTPLTLTPGHAVEALMEEPLATSEPCALPRRIARAIPVCAETSTFTSSSSSVPAPVASMPQAEEAACWFTTSMPDKTSVALVDSETAVPVFGAASMRPRPAEETTESAQAEEWASEAAVLPFMSMMKVMRALPAFANEMSPASASKTRVSPSCIASIA